VTDVGNVSIHPIIEWRGVGRGTVYLCTGGNHRLGRKNVSVHTIIEGSG